MAYMKVKCVANQGKFLSTRSLSAGQLKSSEFQLEIDKLYTVYSISLWKGTLTYLTMDKWFTLPFWHPAELFKVEDHLLPIEWFFKFFGHQEVGLEALWGYQEMIFDPFHYQNLIEREDNAVKTFLKRKEEIDNWYHE
jgi:hypothetical protein